MTIVVIPVTDDVIYSMNTSRTRLCAIVKGLLIFIEFRPDVPERMCKRTYCLANIAKRIFNRKERDRTRSLSLNFHQSRTQEGRRAREHPVFLPLGDCEGMFLANARARNAFVCACPDI